MINCENHRNNMIIRGVDYHSHNTRSKDTIRSIKSSGNWCLLRSAKSALPDWHALTVNIEKLPCNSSRVLLLDRFNL